MTERLYHASDALAFTALIIGHDGDPTRPILDRTAFYPTSGGQPHDTGMLGGARVLDVIDTERGIVHVVDGALPLGEVHGVVDAARRTDFTVQHTAQHLLSALAADRLGWDTASVHFGTDHSSIEFAVARVTPEELEQLEVWANAAIVDDAMVSTGFEDSATAASLRKPTTRSGMVRVVTIAGLDRSACGGTHVPRLARLGLIRVQGTESLRGHTRVGFLAGGRVLTRLRRVEAGVTALASVAECATDELAELIPRRLAALELTEARLVDRTAAWAEVAAERLTAEAKGSGAPWVVVAEADLDLDALRALAQAVALLPGAVFVGSRVLPPLLLIAAHPDSGINAGTLLGGVVRALGGKGGGAAGFAQGTLPDATALRLAVERVVGQRPRGPEDPSPH